MATQSVPAPKVPGFVKWIFKFQVFMLRHNLMGGMGDYVLAITTKGRKSGKEYTVPVGYIRDGEHIISLNPEGRSNWFKNLQTYPDVTLEIRGKKHTAHAEHITDDAEVARLFEYYKNPDIPFERLFGIPLDSPEADIIAARDSREFVRFTLT